MQIRNTSMEDLDAVMALYDLCRQYMRENGNLHQWINGYPSRALIEDDINKAQSYVCEDAEGRLLAVFTFIQGEEPDYRVIRGAWVGGACPYGVVHRLGVGVHRGGVASYCLDWCLARCGDIRIDTHADNIPMQRMLEKNGFICCGEITISDGTPRTAFEMILSLED